MSDQKSHKANRGAALDFSIHPKSFIFLDKATRTPRFEVKADAHGRLPVDQALSLLVAQCLMRKQAPYDFQVMIAGSENLLDQLRRPAERLIRSCPVMDAPVPLTAREREVLAGILQYLSNKELAVKLKISVRTVKFKISALLLKFQVGRRSGLLLKAADLYSIAKAPIKLPVKVIVPLAEVGPGLRVGLAAASSHQRLIEMKALERRAHR